jgi:hypothetical protein
MKKRLPRGFKPLPEVLIPAIAGLVFAGLVTAEGGGTATITVTAADGSGITAFCDVEVIGGMGN